MSDDSKPTAIPPETGGRIGQCKAQDASIARLGASLAPIVRVALRRGVGVPSIANWARRTALALAGGHQEQAERITDDLVRMLTAILLRITRAESCPTRSGQEMVPGACDWHRGPD